MHVAIGQNQRHIYLPESTLTESETNDNTHIHTHLSFWHFGAIALSLWAAPMQRQCRSGERAHCGSRPHPQQYWLHPESHQTRGFNTELRCSSSEGITRALLREIDPQHIQSQGRPVPCTLTVDKHKDATFLVPQCFIVCSPTLSLTHILYIGAEKTAARYRRGYYYASYRAHITHSLYRPTVRPPIIWILIPCYEPLCTITTISHPTTGKTEKSCVVRRTQICSLRAV